MSGLTYLLIKKNVSAQVPVPTQVQEKSKAHIVTENILEPVFSTNCKYVAPILNKPPILFFSCREPIRPAPQEPLRSTFCFPGSTFFNQSLYDLGQLRNQWETFEKVENYNSIVLNNLANNVPVEQGSEINEAKFYQFINSQEKIDYNLGQLYHTVIYPDVTDFQQPYASRPIPYTSTILSTINGRTYINDPSTSTVCSNILPPPPLDSDLLLNNRRGLDIYIRVSTQNSQFPKSPYKFISNQEYITYMNYKKINC